MSILYSVTRAERAQQVADLRAQGLTYREVSERLGISRDYVHDLIFDPTGEKLAARRLAYSGVCLDCGGPTSGSGGRSKAPTRCQPCHLKFIEPEHGTLSRYQHYGCSCDDCRAANREHGRSLKGKTPPTHGYSGYVNYGCRCQVCRDGKLVYDRSKAYEAQRNWYQRQKTLPTPDRVHGTYSGYRNYSCRCDRCRAAANAYHRDYYRRRKEQQT